MRAYTCPGCGLDAPLTNECPRCDADERNNMDRLATRLRLEATRHALRDSTELRDLAVKSLGLRTTELLAVQDQVAALLAELQAAKDEASRQRRMHENMSTDNARLRKELYIAQRRQQEETKRRRRAKAELNMLRDKVAEYEKPVDEQELAELMHHVEAEHAAFDAAQRGDGPDGFARWCGSCETLILAIRKMRAISARVGAPTQAPATEIGRRVRIFSARTGRVLFNPGAELVAYQEIPAHSEGHIVRVSGGNFWIEFVLSQRRVVAEFRPGDVEILDEVPA